ncbi:immunity protein BlpZ [Streptococcus pneumoniae]|nr:immunity protein BlpZ [Streptococcus pneumoniae]CEX24382.1 immunity protein BlpZ [Streptococcus pneumoniae]CEY80787.1 immunity protein BlpZ [Streptococcus pneumoniae]CIP81603.1 immunity protein BlpZ [Streptococcus pneumoniae]CIP88997.1 immunity protein BlpZ [Streptococcus pneumoniae]CIQ30110.1 immunity protein BlpZ [Streptococcus pneumoniae]
MYKHLFFLDSKTLDRLTPYILVLASDTIAFNVFVLTFVSWDVKQETTFAFHCNLSSKCT